MEQRHCRTCERETTQGVVPDTLDASHYVCVTCGVSDFVAQLGPYRGKRRDD
jgi:hypothetical protein